MAAAGIAPSGAAAATPLSVDASGPSVKIFLKPVGSAPVLAKNKFKCPPSERFATVITFLRRQLALRDGDSLLCYLHSAFAPTPAAQIGDLFSAFGSDGELVVHYSLSSAYG